MESFDISAIVVTLLSGVIGVTRGLTREVLGLISWFAAILAAYFGFPFANKIALDYIQNPSIAQYVTYFAIFIIFLILFSIISNVFSSLIKKTMLGGIDRTLGFAFGIARAFILFSIMIISLGFFFNESNTPSFFTNSKSFSHLKIFGDELYDILPEKIQSFIKDRKKTSDDIISIRKKKKRSVDEEKQEQEKNAEKLAHLKTTEEEASENMKEDGKKENSLMDSLQDNIDNILPANENNKKDLKESFDEIFED